MNCASSLPKQTALVALITATLYAVTGNAAPAPTKNSMWYYEIGGASATYLPAHPITTTLRIDLAPGLRSGLACGKFDPRISIQNSLNRASQGVDNMYNAVVSAANAAIANLPMLILQRVNPGLYDLLQNALLKAQAEFALATKTCEQMSSEISQGDNPFDQWVTLSKGEDWKLAAGTSGVSSQDVVATRTTIESNNGRNGVTWIGGSKFGGDGQPDINVNRDIAAAGHNILNGRPANAVGPVPPAAGAVPRVNQVWASPGAAAQWVVDVLGDKIVRTNDSAPRGSVPGKGLMPKLSEEQATVGTDLSNLVTGSTPPTLVNLVAVSPEGTAITREVVEAIQHLTPNEQAFVTQKLAGEVAQARTIEKALLARRLLLTGAKEPHVVAANIAESDVNDAVSQLNKEIDNMLYETRVKREIVSSTALTLLRKEHSDRSESLRAPSVTEPANPYKLEDGAVTP